MSAETLDRQERTAPCEGYLTIEIEGVEHEYRVEEGDEIVWTWEEADG
jgi:hypothetical protein